ncbi:MAG: hydrogenase maturation nickel metallochaperone HypA [Ignavibacteria bacterium]|nr:hydrogenase maturation nickel metallochaperone HypA [Ignavibacteria bacterium]
MHELSIAQNIFDLVRENVNGNARVKNINMKLGEISGVVSESLEFCFEVITKGTELENAVLKIEKIPVTAKCNECNLEFNVENLFFLCPECGSPDVKILTGTEMQVTEIEIDD